MKLEDLPAHGLEKRDHRQIDIDSESILGFACVRNEMLRLPYFLDYHRSLGVERFFIIDNASDDGTAELLLSQEDVHVFLARGSYASSNHGLAWLNALLSCFAVGHWALTLDADELFIFPGCEEVGLRRLVTFLESEQADALITFLIDMYSDRPVREAVYEVGTPFIETCPFFDLDTYHEVGKDGVPVRGGARHRLFWEQRGRPKPSPVLKKIPLVKWQRGLQYEASTHSISRANLSAVRGGLLHFKLFSDFPATALREVGRKEHWDDAAQYRSYLQGFEENPDINAYGSSSTRYQGSLQLVDLGLMHMPPAFEASFGEIVLRRGYLSDP